MGVEKHNLIMFRPLLGPALGWPRCDLLLLMLLRSHFATSARTRLKPLRLARRTIRNASIYFGRHDIVKEFVQAYIIQEGITATKLRQNAIQTNEILKTWHDNVAGRQPSGDPLGSNQRRKCLPLPLPNRRRMRWKQGSWRPTHGSRHVTQPGSDLIAESALQQKTKLSLSFSVHDDRL
jgi:hypothetical protein